MCYNRRMPILADFTALHRGSALPSDLRTDTAYWAYIQRWFSAWAAMPRRWTYGKTIPFDEEGNPDPIIAAPPMLVWINDNVVKAQCPACGKSGPVRRLNPLTICLDCWGAEDGADGAAGCALTGHLTYCRPKGVCSRRPNPRHRNWHRQLPYAESLARLGGRGRRARVAVKTGAIPRPFPAVAETTLASQTVP